LPACLYWQPQWWMHGVLNLSPEDSFAAMGDFCDEYATTPELRRPCFEGIGNIVEQESGSDPKLAVALCDKVSSKASDRLLCRSIGANHFGIDVGKEAGEEMCEGLTGDSREYCLAYAGNRANIMNVLPDPL
jgi:hypothetical protein